MTNRLCPLCLLLLTALLTGEVALSCAAAAESPKAVKKIVLIAGQKSHGPGDHEYEKGVKLLKHCLDTSPNVTSVKTEVYLEGWPQDGSVLEDADTILFYCDGSDRDEQAHPLLRGNRLQTIDRLMKRGVGFVAIHYAVFVPSKKGGEQFLDWLGGYFDYENGTAANKWYSKIVTKDYQVTPVTPEHPIARGLRPFEVREEYYFNMRFRENDRRLTPILSFSADKSDLSSVVGWAVERADGGRGFGYTGGHFHKNWDKDRVRKMMLNALLWTAKVEVPPGGVESKLPADERAKSEQPGNALKTLIVTGHQYPGHLWRETTAGIKEVPLEIHTMTLTKAGFELTFTKPL